MENIKFILDKLYEFKKMNLTVKEKIVVNACILHYKYWYVFMLINFTLLIILIYLFISSFTK